MVEGILVCADLALADVESKRRMILEFDESGHWEKQTALENGGTRVYRKVSK